MKRYCFFSYARNVFWSVAGSSAPKQEVRKSSEDETPAVTPTTLPSVAHIGPVDIDKFVPDAGDAENFLNEIPEHQR